MLIPMVFFVRIHLGQEMRAHTRENPDIHQIETLNLAKQDDWLKETQTRCPVTVVQATARMRLALNLSVCLSHTRTLLLMKHLTCFASFCVYVEIHFYTVTGPCHRPLVPGGLVTRIQHSHCRGLTSISGQKQKSCFKCLQAQVT